MHANKLLISLENSQDQSFEIENKTTSAKTKTKTKTKTAKFRSEDQDHGIEDYISGYNNCLLILHALQMTATTISDMHNI